MASASSASCGSSTCPPTANGRRFIIERELTVMAELEAIVADYLEQAAAWDVIPASGCCPLLADDREAER